MKTVYIERPEVYFWAQYGLGADMWALGMMVNALTVMMSLAPFLTLSLTYYYYLYMTCFAPSQLYEFLTGGEFAVGSTAQLALLLFLFFRASPIRYQYI